MMKEERCYDVFRDSLLRYAGYANEVGESFRYQFPKLVAPSYFVAFGYCIADKNHDTEKTPFAVHDTLRATVDTLLWQSLASVMIPGAIINLIVKAGRFAVLRSPLVLPVLLSEWLPTATGLCSIPLIVGPIDSSVDKLLDNTVRVWWQDSTV
jgi:mitochondrial fission process protein 1